MGMPFATLRVFRCLIAWHRSHGLASKNARINRSFIVNAGDPVHIVDVTHNFTDRDRL